MSGSTGAVYGLPSVVGQPMATPESDSGAGAATTVSPQWWPLVTSLELGALPTAAGCARLHAKSMLAEWNLDQHGEDAALLVSELVTNALQASRSLAERPPITLRLLADHQQLIIEVWDRSPADLTTPDGEDPASERGRGLQIVAGLSSRWGVQRLDASLKVVWCELVLGT